MPQAGKTFRIFISSTFSDLKLERDALQQEVFPKLREPCMQDGCRFQAIDLRWGVSEEAALDQQTMKICLEEIKRCQRVTPRPNFIVLLGDRYGWRPLPTEIPAKEFEQIIRKVSDEDKAVLVWHENQPEGQKGWYRRDDNAVASVYCLQERGEEYEEYSNWEKVERKLRSSFESAIEGMTFGNEEAHAKYVASATEQEIAQGLKGENPSEHAFCFFRSIANYNDLANDLPQQKGAKDLVELDENGSPDNGASKRLENLKRRLSERLPARNVHDYKAQWLGNRVDSESKSLLTQDHIGSLPESLDECLKLINDENAPSNLCVDVWRQLARVIIAEIKQIEAVEPFERDKEEHQKFGQKRAEHFRGRASYLKAINQYVIAGDQSPFALWGESGSGKSALLAYAAEQIHNGNPNAELVIRFIGATPQSSDARALLEGLCHEISGLYGAEQDTIPTDYNGLIKEFPKRLALAAEQKPLVLILDALDQLSDADHGRSLIWLPNSLSENVRLIVSTVPGECLTALQRKNLPAESILCLEAMPRSEGGEVLDLWLKDARRTLQEEQCTEVLSKFAENGLPLYLKLAFEEARLWHSYSGVSPLAMDVPASSAICLIDFRTKQITVR